MPLGAKGTIISIQPLTDSNPVRQENINAVEYFYDILFDEPFEGGTSIDGVAEKSLFKVRQSVLMNITYGVELNQSRKLPQANKTRNGNFNDNKTRNSNLNDNKNQAPPIQIMRKGNGDNAANNQTYSQVLSRNPKNTNQSRTTPNNWRDGPNQNADNNRPNKKQNNVENWRGNNANKKDNSKINSADKSENIVRSNIPNPIPIQQMADLNIGSIPFTNSTDDSSDALRKMLGISSAVQTNKEAQQPHTTPIDLNAIFNKPSLTTSVEPILPHALPKPPENWRLRSNDAKDIKDELFTNKVELTPQAKPQQSQPQLHAPQQAAQLNANAQIMHQNVPTLPHSTQFPQPHTMHVPPNAHGIPPPAPFMIPPNHTGPFMAPPVPAAMQPPFNNHGQAIHVMRPNGPYHPLPIPNHPPFVQGMNLFYAPPQLPPAFSNRPDAPKQNNSFGHNQRQHQHQQQMPHSRQGPNGPHMLKTNNSRYTPGHGAFIPLQAARKNVKPKPVAEPQQAVTIQKVWFNVTFI